MALEGGRDEVRQEDVEVGTATVEAGLSEERRVPSTVVILSPWLGGCWNYKSDVEFSSQGER